MISTFLTWERRPWRAAWPAIVVSGQPEPRDAAVQTGIPWAVSQALQTLSARQRALVMLRFFDDLTEAQAADALGCSVGTVRSQTARALSRLRKCPQLHGVL